MQSQKNHRAPCFRFFFWVFFGQNKFIFGNLWQRHTMGELEKKREKIDTFEDTFLRPFCTPFGHPYGRPPSLKKKVRSGDPPRCARKPPGVQIFGNPSFFSPEKDSFGHILGNIYGNPGSNETEVRRQSSTSIMTNVVIRENSWKCPQIIWIHVIILSYFTQLVSIPY